MKQTPHRIKRKGSSRIKKSHLAKADAVFSKRILARDKHCQFPNCKQTKRLTCSHYIGRAVKSTRFDEENCIALCLFHHFFSKDLGFEFQKQTKVKHGYDGQYTLFMRSRLGTTRFNALVKRAKKKLTLTREYLEQLIATLK